MTGYRRAKKSLLPMSVKSFCRVTAPKMSSDGSKTPPAGRPPARDEVKLGMLDDMCDYIGRCPTTRSEIGQWSGYSLTRWDREALSRQRHPAGLARSSVSP